ncbi:MAG: DinB family protein [Bacteroidota bacterium]
MKYTPQDGFPYYFELSENIDCLTLFSSLQTLSFLKSIDEKQVDHRYAVNKWSIKQVVGHITDHERIKMNRAFFLSRNQPVELWGYDQNALVENSRFERLSYNLLLEDYWNVRKASISFIKTLSMDQLKLIGNARYYKITLEEFLKTIIGHEVHHINILKERYLQ